MLTRDAILSVVDLPRESVEVPEWGGTVCVRTLTAAERDRFEISTIERRKAGRPTRFRAYLAALAVCDESGVRLFEDADADALEAKSSAALDRVAAVAMRLSKIGESDVKELEKN